MPFYKKCTDFWEFKGCWLGKDLNEERNVSKVKECNTYRDAMSNVVNFLKNNNYRIIKKSKNIKMNPTDRRYNLDYDLEKVIYFK